MCWQTRALRNLFASLTLPVLASAQAGPAGPGQAPRRPMDSSPFRRLDLGDFKVDLMGLNDEACPAQIQAGRVFGGSGGHRGVAVLVKNVAGAAVEGLALTTFVFDARGLFKWTRDSGIQAALSPTRVASVDLPLDYANLANGDILVVAVKGADASDTAWNSDAAELRSAAEAFARRRAAR